MEIGIFLPTGTRGYLISSTAPLNEPTFDLNRYVVQAADRYGVEFALSMVKFRGFGGKSRYWDGALEPFTLTGALAAVSSRIKLFPTAASLVMPPAIVARMAATLNDIAPGRIGINVITGWQKAEYDQMGAWPGDVHFNRRYDVLSEYVQVMRELWSTGRSDFQGDFYQMEDCRLEPWPKVNIPLVVAGGSDRGLEFAAQYCDYNFCAAPNTINTPEACAAPIERLQRAAARYGRTVRALVWVSVITAETDEKAEEKWECYRQGTDDVALAWSKAQASVDQASQDQFSTKARITGNPSLSPTASMKLIGSYRTIAQHLDRMAEIPGMVGVMLSFDDFRGGIDQFGEYIQPLMRSREGIAHATEHANGTV